jgi:predicted flap endonuclease-1-like 5' DNA nuclease
VKILPNMVSFTSTLPPDVVSAEFSKGIIYLDLEMTPALEAEGFAREMVRRIQQMRKDMGLNVEEFIRVELECSPKIEGVIDQWRDRICRETRARKLDCLAPPKGEYIVEWNVANEPLLIGLTSLKMKAGLDALSSIPGVTTEKAMKLFEAGYTSLEQLKTANPEEVALVDGITKADAKKVHEHLNKAEAQPATAPAQPQAAPAPPAAGPQAQPVPFLETLKSVDGMRSEVADAIFEAGYISAQSLKTASAEDLARVKGVDQALATSLIEHFMGVAAEPAQQAIRPPVARPVDKLSELERSFSYLVEEDKPETSYTLFLKTLKKGMKGYCVTRNYPAKIRSKFDLKDTPVIWLSNVGRDNAIRPKDLEKLSLSLEQFLSQSGGGIVLLDGLEYLITNNNFITVLRLIQSLRDQVAINQSILLMAVNRSTLESHQLNLLEREVDYTIQG